MFILVLCYQGINDYFSNAILADNGHQRKNDYLPHAIIPFKASKNNPLTDEQKAFNAKPAKYRVVIEHKNREIKIFRICKETYRSKGKRGLLRGKIVASLYNHRCALSFLDRSTVLNPELTDEYGLLNIDNEIHRISSNKTWNTFPIPA